MRSRKQTAFLIGPFAPPVHGVTMSNGKLERLLAARGKRVRRIDISSGAMKRGLTYHARRVARTVRGFATIVTAPPAVFDRRVYEMSVDGGAGQVYNILLAFAVRLRKAPLALYHHSTSYIVSDSRTMRALLTVAGADVVHIACSRTMLEQLRERYGGGDRTLVLSNAVWLDNPAPAVQPELHGVRLGYLSALTEEKGVLRAVAVLRELRERGIKATLTIAGAGVGRGVAEHLAAAKSEFGSALDCRGQVSESEKQHLLASFDYFLFPSLYPHETQSSAVPEALAAGAWVVAYDHRFVGEFLRTGGGTLISVLDDFGASAATWIAQNASYESRLANKVAARAHGAKIRAEASDQLERLLEWLDAPP